MSLADCYTMSSLASSLSLALSIPQSHQYSLSNQWCRYEHAVGFYNFIAKINYVLEHALCELMGVFSHFSAPARTHCRNSQNLYFWGAFRLVQNRRKPLRHDLHDLQHKLHAHYGAYCFYRRNITRLHTDALHDWTPAKAGFHLPSAYSRMPSN